MYVKKSIIILLLITHSIVSQTIQGTFPQAKNTKIVLKGFEGFTEKELTKTTTDSLGNFTLVYPKTYQGAALLQIQNASSVIVLLNHENFEMRWQNLQDFTTLKFINSPENDAFAKGNTIDQEAELKLHGLKFLLPQYKNLAPQQQWLTAEITNQEMQFSNFLNQLSKDSYAKYYLKIRKMITDFPQTANRYIERMPQHEIDFKNINFNEEQLWTSGLLADLCNGFYQLMESHIDSDKVTEHCNQATDAWIKSLSNNPTRQQVVAEHGFKWLEKRSLLPAADH